MRFSHKTESVLRCNDFVICFIIFILRSFLSVSTISLFVWVKLIFVDMLSKLLIRIMILFLENLIKDLRMICTVI